MAFDFTFIEKLKTPAQIIIAVGISGAVILLAYKGINVFEIKEQLRQIKKEQEFRDKAQADSVIDMSQYLQ